MIYEIRTYELRAGTVPTWVKRFEDGLPTREKYSKLGGFWTTEIGQLNTVTHLWPYEDMKHREEARAAAAKDASGKWPPKGDDCILTQESEIINPSPFMRPLNGSVQQLGGVYELRIYTYQNGAPPKVINAWSPVVGKREQFSPLLLSGFSELGGLNRWFHLWPYKDLAARVAVRAEAAKANIGWPAPTSEWVMHQKNMILIPSSFSPLR